ncbi:hypothetical protein ABEV74_10900 [Paenibacillus cisolokensis]|uniref:hypothetical protein n=1 Tax=Paenibacillus cisolokensis TaxID=1658519 RepID=UPI003D2A81FB
MKLADIMRRSHELAKGFEGHYAARLALALRQAWAEAKAVAAASKLVGLDLCRGIEWTEEAAVVTEVHSGWSKGWLARVTLAAPGARYDLHREFIGESKRDMSRAGNGTKTYKLSQLADGIYEADSVYRSYTSFRTYFRVAGGKVVELYENKAVAKAALAAVKEAA